MTNYRQRSALLQAVIVKRPSLGLVLRRGPTAHSTQLSRWIHTVNTSDPFMQQSHLGYSIQNLAEGISDDRTKEINDEA